MRKWLGATGDEAVSDAKIPRYMRKLVRRLRDRQVIPGVHHVTIRHDDDCTIWTTGTCNCDAEVETPFQGRN